MGNKLTQRELKRAYKYDPETGIFTKKANPDHAKRLKEIYGADSKRWCGEKIHFEDGGFKRKNEYVYIWVNGRCYGAHRAAFLYMRGYLPENIVDHINRIRWDNRWINLREVSVSCNSRNRTINKNNKTGVMGVFYCKKSNRFIAGITPQKGKHTTIGRFKTLLEAAECRYAAEVELGYPNCDMNSTALQYINKCKKGY